MMSHRVSSHLIDHPYFVNLPLLALCPLPPYIGDPKWASSTPDAGLPLAMTSPISSTRALALALLLVLLSSPAAAHDPDPDSGDHATDPPSSAPTDDGADDDQSPPFEREQALLDQASEITAKVAAIRGLPQQYDIQKGVKDRDQLRAMLIERLEQDMSAQDFERQARVFRRLGLFDQDLDYRDLMLDLLTEQIAGFYDQSSGELYIMEGLPASLQESTMAHEIFHALQDQHFDIGQLLAADIIDDNDDFTLARMALIEGDATVLMIDYELYGHGALPQGDNVSVADVPAIAALLLELNTADMSAVEQLAPTDAMDLGDEMPSLTDSVLGSAPPIIRDTLLFPYIEGLRFVLRARAGRTWEEFDAIYDDPPLTTSQIFDPESYFEGPPPLDVRFDASAAVDVEPIFDNAFGELQTRAWLRTFEDDIGADPDDAARGLRGDRLRAYPVGDGDEEVVVAHLSSWRSTDQARRFAQALEDKATSRHDLSVDHRRGTHGESWCMRSASDHPTGERLLIERWGDMVLYIEGAPSLLDDQGVETDPTLFHVRDTIWQTHRRQHLDEVIDHHLESTSQ